MYPQVNIFRIKQADQGTLGLMRLPSGWSCYSLELPWRDNKCNISHIPPGRYPVVWARSARYGWKYLLQEVPGRTWVRIHKGNYAGDKALSYKTHSAGCILLGRAYGVMQGQQAVFSSGTTVRQFEERMEKQKFILNILDPGDF